jgi:hypothetical protein
VELPQKQLAVTTVVADQFSGLCNACRLQYPTSGSSTSFAQLALPLQLECEFSVAIAAFVAIVEWLLCVCC